MYNCQLLIDLAGRNALWGAAAHLFEAFKPLGPSHNTPAAALAPSPAQNSNLFRASSGLQRGGSGVSPMDPRRGALGAAPAAAKLPSQDSLAQGKACCLHVQHCSKGMCSGLRAHMYMYMYMGMIALTNKRQYATCAKQCMLHPHSQLLSAVLAHICLS